jgi:hypothetical protein
MIERAATALWNTKVLGGITDVTNPTSMVSTSQGRHLIKELIGGS